MSATDIVDVLRGGMWLLSDEQRREAADMLLALKARAEAAEQHVEELYGVLQLAWENIDPFQVTDETEATITAMLEAKP